MHYVLNAAQMKRCDLTTIETLGIASLVLQERAALSVCKYINDESPEPGAQRSLPDKGQVRLYAGVGNNGADALACARILSARGYRPLVLLFGDEARATQETRAQMKSLNALGIKLLRQQDARDDKALRERPVCVVDGLIGIGLHRAPEGAMAEAIRDINALGEQGVRVIAIDIPSGVNADDGAVPGEAVRADLTVTFAFRKAGQLLYPGASYSGKLVCEDIGIPEASLPEDTPPAAFCYLRAEEVPLPKRRPDGNKGTFGKVLLMAGCETIGGAAILAAQAAFRGGAGMVRVLTARANRDALLQTVPEALIDVYDKDITDKELEALCETACAWADVIVAGPGIGTDALSLGILRTLFTKGKTPMVLDADALNLLSMTENGLMDFAREYAKKDYGMVLTPHVGEFCRLYAAAFDRRISAEECKANLMQYPKELAEKLGAVVLCKDARSVAAAPAADGDSDFPPLYLNISGNEGMATAGSGDVLAGLTGALIAGGVEAFDAACSAAFLHGHAGDLAAAEKGTRVMTATDISRALTTVLRL